MCVSLCVRAYVCACERDRLRGVQRNNKHYSPETDNPQNFTTPVSGGCLYCAWAVHSADIALLTASVPLPYHQDQKQGRVADGGVERG